MNFGQLLSLIHKGTLMGQVIFLAQLTGKFHLIFLFFSPISIICGFWLVLVSLTFLPLFLFPTGLLIALLEDCAKTFVFWGEGETFAASAIECLTNNSWSCLAKYSTVGDFTEPTTPSAWGPGLGFSTLWVGLGASGMISYRIPE